MLGNRGFPEALAHLCICRRLLPHDLCHERSSSCWLLAQLCATTCTVARQALRPWDSPGKNTGVGCHAFFQGIFPTQGWNPCILMSPALLSGFFTWEDLGRQRDPSANPSSATDPRCVLRDKACLQGHLWGYLRPCTESLAQRHLGLGEWWA